MGQPDEAKHLLVGTAGHVDHGKTTLIKAMTGINTDRLKEEQERGLTIDLGFAHLTLPSGRVIGIVDVPGHERFLKNMLAGASGVDIALVVVAADEGVMPQTREHLQILELLETRQGVVALTKCDMAEPEWLDVVEEDLRDFLNGTSLAEARIVRVSGETGSGIDDLVREIDRLAGLAQQRSSEGPFRLPVDRVFTMTGFGTVVTGTLVSGTMRLGDPVRVLPQGIDSRIRQLQVHSEKQDAVYAGSRVAVNLVGVDVSEMERGSVLVPPGYLAPSRRLDASVAVLSQSPRPLKDRTPIRVHIGTAEAIGWAVALGAEEIPAGGKGLIQLRLATEIVATRGDRFVLRFYSPASLLGGGIVLDAAAGKHRRFDAAVIERLQRALKGDPADIVEDALRSSEAGLVARDVPARTGLGAPEVDQALATLVDEGRVIRARDRFLQKTAFEVVAARLRAAIEAYHAANPTRPGMPREELRAVLGSRADPKGLQAVLSLMADRGEVAVSEATVKLPGHAAALSPRQQQIAASIEADYRRTGVNPPFLAETEQRYGPGADRIVAFLVDRGDLIRIAPELVFHRQAIEEAETVLVQYLEANGRITVARFRDLIDSSRKFVVPLLEYFDSRRVTRRLGDDRALFGR